MYSGASTFVDGVDTAFVVILGISLFFLVAITFAMVYFIIKYNHKKHPEPEAVKESSSLEIIWTVIPTLLVLVMFYYGWVGYKPMREIPDGAMTVKATGFMWDWSFEYENGRIEQDLVVPVNKPVRLDLFSPDVLHSLYIPAFRIKEDVVPGRDNVMWFQATQIDSFQIFCAEYCGTWHSKMLAQVIVLPEAEYAAWYNADNSTPATTPAADNTAAPAEKTGEQLMADNNCFTCHSKDGTKLVGPSFKGLFGKTQKVVTADGETVEVVADEDYIKRSIYDSDAEVVEGFTKGMMVAYGYKDKLSEEDVVKMTDYIKSLDE